MSRYRYFICSQIWVLLESRAIKLAELHVPEDEQAVAYLGMPRTNGLCFALGVALLVVGIWAAVCYIDSIKSFHLCLDSIKYL